MEQVAIENEELVEKGLMKMFKNKQEIHITWMGNSGGDSTIVLGSIFEHGKNTCDYNKLSFSLSIWNNMYNHQLLERRTKSPILKQLNEF
jgi:hypothetical protein